MKFLPSLPPVFSWIPFVYWGWRTGGRINLPPVSLPFWVPFTPIRIEGGLEDEDGRETGGITFFPPVPQCLCTQAFRAKTGEREGCFVVSWFSSPHIPPFSLQLWKIVESELSLN